MLIEFILHLTVAVSGAQEGQGSVNPRLAVLLSEEQGRTFSRQCSRPAPGPLRGTWTPDEDTIRRLEHALGPALEIALDRASIPAAGARPSATDYYRQYAGLVVGEKRIVYINGLHQRTVRDGQKYALPWRTEPVSPCDGGTAFFGAEYDPATGRIENIHFNVRF